MAIRSRNVDGLNLSEMFSNETSGTHLNFRYGATAIAEAQPNRMAYNAAMVRRSLVFTRAPMRSSSALSGPDDALASSAPVPHRSPGSGRPSSTLQLGLIRPNPSNT